MSHFTVSNTFFHNYSYMRKFSRLRNGVSIRQREWNAAEGGHW